MSSTPQLRNTHVIVPSSSVWADKIAPALLAVALGGVLVFGMGFVDISAVHNAAHDGRHSAGFPCH